MDVVSPFPALVVLVVACLSVFLLAGPLRIAPHGRNRVSTIDGLRGYLGLGVYLHHSVIWYFYLSSGTWAGPPSRFYSHLGQMSVALFFMITSFLFYSKILDSRPIDWTRLYVSRLLRLGPLYLVAVSGMLVLVGLHTGWQLRVPVTELLASIGRWLLFLKPDVNQVHDTYLLLAGVTWTLPYEWAFYFALPLIALASRRRVPVAALLVAALVPVCILGAGLRLHFFGPFLGGIIAAVLVRLSWFRWLAVSRACSLVVLACPVFVVTHYSTAYYWVPLVVLSLAFSLIAAGNSVFGLLTTRVSRAMGEITYSIYLLHGLLLHVLWRVLLGGDGAAQPSPLGFWLVIILATPVLMGLSMLSFKVIEEPAMRQVGRATDLLTGAGRLFRGLSPGRLGG